MMAEEKEKANKREAQLFATKNQLLAKIDVIISNFILLLNLLAVSKSDKFI